MALSHKVEGKGPVVLLAPALGTTLELWNPQAEALRGHFRVVRYDHPGHGGSAPAAIAGMDDLARGVVSLLDDLEVERASVCGVSLGGAVAMQLALDAPERVERLVLACTSARFGTPQLWEDRIALVRERGMEALADTLVARWFTPAFPDVQRFRAMLTATPPNVYIGYCEVLRNFDLRGQLGAIRARTLAVAGEHDPASPPVDLEAIAAEISAARFALIEGAAHLANAERPDAFNALLARHLD